MCPTNHPPHTPIQNAWKNLLEACPVMKHFINSLKMLVPGTDNYILIWIFIAHRQLSAICREHLLKGFNSLNLDVNCGLSGFSHQRLFKNCHYSTCYFSNVWCNWKWGKFWLGKITQWVKVFAIKPDYFCGAHTKKGENQFWETVLWPLPPPAVELPSYGKYV